MLLRLKPHQVILILIGVSFALRITLAFGFAATPYFDFTLNASGPDQNFFAHWAKHIQQGHWSWERVPKHLPFQFAPLYSTLLAQSFQITSSPFTLILTLQSLMSALVLGAFYGIGKMLHSKKLGMIAACLWALYLPSYYYDSCLIRTSLITSMTTFLTWAFLLAVYKRQNTFACIATGLLGGFLCALRPNLFFIILPVLYFAFHFRHGFTQALFKSFIIALLSFAVISPITIRNYIAAEKFVPVSSQGADALLLGNDPSGPGIGMAPTQRSGMMKKFSENKASKAISLIAKDIKNNPDDFLKLYARKLQAWANAYEIPANYSLYIFKRLQPLSGGIFVGWWVIFPLAVWGLLKAPRHNQLWRVWILLTGILFMSMIVIHIQSRYRMPVVPFIILYAAYGIHVLEMALREKKFATLFSGILFIACVAVFIAPNPSNGLHHVVGSDGIKKVNSNPIRQFDYITWLISMMLVDVIHHDQQIKDVSVEAHKTYGSAFIKDFDRAAKRLLNS